MECPNCKNKTIVKDGQPTCNFCGAFAEIYQENSTLQWILDGRVIVNEKMARDAWEQWKTVYPDSFAKAEDDGQAP